MIGASRVAGGQRVLDFDSVRGGGKWRICTSTVCHTDLHNDHQYDLYLRPLFLLSIGEDVRL
jgi:hypothetical protein